MVERKFIEIQELRQDRELTLKQIKAEIVKERERMIAQKKEKKVLGIVKRRRSIGGRIEAGFRVGQKGLTRSLIERAGGKIPKGRLQIKRAGGKIPKGRLQMGQRLRPQPIPPQPKTPSDLFFERVFSSGLAMANQVEREIISPNGAANLGDNVAFRMSKNNPVNVFDELEKATNFHANFQDIIPVGDVAKEAMFFANLLP